MAALMHKEDFEDEDDAPMEVGHEEDELLAPTRVRELTQDDHENIVAPDRLRLVTLIDRGTFECSAIIKIDAARIAYCCGLPIANNTYAFCNAHAKRFLVPARGRPV